MPLNPDRSVLQPDVAEDWFDGEGSAGPGQTVQVVHKTDSTWPDRPTTDPAVVVLWVSDGSEPPATVTTPAVNGMYATDVFVGAAAAEAPAPAPAMPAGAISLWAADVAPADWLICDGSAVSRATYASLFAAIGTAFGAGDGSTTFNLPNLKGRTPVGKDAAQTEFNALAKTGGEKAHLLTAAESGLPVHNHEQDPHYHHVGASQAGNGTPDVYLNQESATPTYAGWSVALQATSGGLRRIVATTNTVSNKANAAANAAQAHNNLQPYSVVNFIIKFTNGDAPGDSQLTQRVSTLETNSAGFGRDRGSGAAWPATDLRRGDAFYLTTVAQLGVYTGTAWRLIGRGTVAATADRDGLTWAYAGLKIQVTAVPAEYEYDGAVWKAKALPRVQLPFLNGWANFDPGFHPALVWTEGRTGFCTGLIKNPAQIAAATNQNIGQLPVGYRPGPSHAGKPLPMVQFYNGLSPLRFDVLGDGMILMNNATGPVIPAGQFITVNLFWNLD